MASNTEKQAKGEFVNWLVLDYILQSRHLSFRQFLKKIEAPSIERGDSERNPDPRRAIRDAKKNNSSLQSHTLYALKKALNNLQPLLSDEEYDNLFREPISISSSIPIENHTITWKRCHRPEDLIAPLDRAESMGDYRLELYLQALIERLHGSVSESHEPDPHLTTDDFDDDEVSSLINNLLSLTETDAEWALVGEEQACDLRSQGVTGEGLRDVIFDDSMRRSRAEIAQLILTAAAANDHIFFVAEWAPPCKARPVFGEGPSESGELAEYGWPTVSLRAVKAGRYPSAQTLIETPPHRAPSHAFDIISSISEGEKRYVIQGDY